MSEERKIILNLLAEGRITADEAEQLLEALDESDLYGMGDSGTVDEVDQVGQAGQDNLVRFRRFGQPWRPALM